jgi:hypothetical protein
MAIAAIFKNHGAAMGALDELDDSGLGLNIEPGRNIREKAPMVRGKKLVIKEEAQLLIEVPPGQENVSDLVARIQDIVAKFEGRLVL